MPATKLSSLLNKSFLNGDGTVAVRGDKDALSGLLKSNSPFTDDDVQEILVIDVEAEPSRDFSFGDSQNLTLGVKAGGSIGATFDIIRHDDTDGIQRLAGYDLDRYLTDETMYLALTADAKATVGLDLKQRWSQYGLSAFLSAEAGADAHFAYLRPFDVDGHTARKVLEEFFGRLRLPQSVREKNDLPIPGEVLRLAYAGYLKASGGLSWGYAMTRSAGFALNDLDLKERIYLEAEANLNLGFAIAGNFDVEVRRARDDDENWARVIVRKAASRSFEFAADINVEAELETENLPDKPTAFLDGLLRLRVTDTLGEIGAYIDKFSDTNPDDLIDELKAKADGLASKHVDAFTDLTIGKTLDKIASNEEILKLHEALVEVKETHDHLGAKVVGFIEDELDAVPLDDLITKIKQATNDLKDAAGLQSLTDSKAWRLVEVLVDKEWLDLIDNTDSAFDDLKKRIDDLQQTKLKKLQTFIEAKRDALGLAPLLDEITSIDPRDLKKEVNRHLQSLLERLTGVAADKLKKLKPKEIEELQKKVGDLQDEITSFTDKLYEHFKDALSRSFELSLAHKYRYAKSNDSLLDVEINLAARKKVRDGIEIPSGPTLMKGAVSGDFAEVLMFAGPDTVVIRKGLLTHAVTRSHEININLFGWQSSRFEELITKVDEVIEQKDGGVLHVYGVEAKSTSKRQRRSEAVEQALAFKVLAEGFQPTGAEHRRTIEAVNAMSSSYSLRTTDEKTTREELREYLAFADEFGLIPAEYGGVENFIDDLAEQLDASDGDFGPSTFKYRLQYNESDLLRIFEVLSRQELTETTRKTLRQVAYVAYKDYGRFSDLREVYINPGMRELWQTKGLNLDSPGMFEYHVTAEGETRRIRLTGLQRRMLDTIYKLERSAVESLLGLDAIMDEAASGKKPNIDELTDRLEQFVSLQSDLNKHIGFGDRAVVPPLIAVLNRLSSLATRKPKTWRTTLELKFPGEKPVTRLFVG